MSAPVDVLAVMDAAKRVAFLCDPLVRIAQHPASNSLEAQAFNLRGEIDAARAAVAELIEAMNELLTHTIGCEILLKIHATETVAKAKAALARVKGGVA